MLYKNRTNFFRDDLDWERIVTFLDVKYKNAENVNVINAACSDGTEPLSLAVMLMEKIKSGVSKFFPIKASDVDDVIIDKAQNQPCNISDVDLYMINKHTRSNTYKYFIPVKSTDKEYPMALEPKKNIKSQIRFKKAGIFEALSDIKNENNVILCRNFWVYLAEESRRLLIDVLKHKLTPSSTVVIGELENGCEIDKLLTQAGFKEVGIRNVYEKLG